MIIKFNEELKEVLDNMISGMLPHENYDGSLLMDIEKLITRYIKVEEMDLEYLVFMNIVDSIKKVYLGLDSSFMPKITKDSVDLILQNDLIRFVSTEGFKFKNWFDLRGVSNDFSNNLNIEQAASKLYAEVMELYERCYEKAVPSSESVSFSVAYRAAFLDSVSESTIVAQAEIIKNGMWYNKEYYKSSEDWIKYMDRVVSEINNRLNDDLNEDTKSIDSVEKAISLLEKARSTNVPISTFGIPPLDDFIPVVSNRLTVICSKEGVGKTTYCSYLANNIIRDRKKVLIMTGESNPDNIYISVLQNFIYKEFGAFVSINDIIHSQDAHEEIQKIINLGVAKLAELGLFHYRPAYTYETVYQELVADYEKYKFDIVIVDHSAALLSNGKLKGEKEQIDHLAVSLRNFKNKYGVGIVVTSHFSVNAQAELTKFGRIYDNSPTRGSSVLSKEADDIFILTVNEKLEKQSMRAFQAFKRRGASKASIGTIIMKVLFNCGEWVYDPKLQSNDGFDEMEVSAAIDNIETIYGGSEDGDEEEIEMDLF